MTHLPQKSTLFPYTTLFRSIAYDQLQDPYGITFWPMFKGRDGCRTPMPWSSDSSLCGFSNAESWLPIPAEHRQRAVSLQDDDQNSVLNSYRNFIRWRKQQPVLREGDIKFLSSPKDVLMFVRSHGDDKLLAVFNFSA